MIRFPKRNIAQGRPKKAEKEKVVIDVDDLSIAERGALADQLGIGAPPKNAVQRVGPSGSGICEPAPNAGHLYPQALWKLHAKLEAAGQGATYLADTPGGRREERSMWELLPPSMRQAEEQADKILQKFMEEKLSQIGAQRFYEQIQGAMSEKAQLIFAYRCVIAATHEDYIPDTLEVYCNKGMDGWDFYNPEDIEKVLNPITGNVNIYIHDEKYDGAYDRAEKVVSRKHRKVHEEQTGQELSEKDKLPPHVLLRMRGLLRGAGVSVPQNNKEAWDMLGTVAAGATIEDKIIGRIAYLIANAVMNKKQGKLPDSI